jgi:ABC-type multidrug transport system fused ATPase/permease subunit
LNTIVQASFLKNSFDAIARENWSELKSACLYFFIETLLLLVYNGTIWTLYASFSVRLVGVLRRKLFQKVAGLSLSCMEEKTSGEWLTRLNDDVIQASAIFNQPLRIAHAAVSIVNICVSSVILSIVNAAIFPFVVLFIIPHVLISQLFVANPVTRMALKSKEAISNNSNDMSTLILCADTAVLYDAQDFLLKRFEESSLKIRQYNMKIKIRQAMGTGLLPLMGMSGYLVILIIGGRYIASGAMTYGDLTAAFQYRGGMLIGSMMLTNSLINIRTDLAGIRRVNETMNFKSEE